MHIELTPQEQVIVDQITFDERGIDDHESYVANGALVRELMHHLMQRDAIPENRVAYFVDPDYFIGGRGKSHQDVFERNRCRGDAVFEHAHFLKNLRYFLFGPDLPNAVQTQFKEAVDDCGMLTSSDIIPLANTARDLARRSNLGRDSHEEFFKLALDAGLNPGDARFARDKVRQLRL